VRDVRVLEVASLVALGLAALVVSPHATVEAREAADPGGAGKAELTTPGREGAIEDTPRPFEAPGPSFVRPAPTEDRSGPLRLSIDLEPSVLVPVSDQFQIGVDLPLRARLEWNGLAALVLGGGAGYHEVLDREGNFLLSGEALVFPLTAGASFLLDLSGRYSVRLRVEAIGGWFFIRNRVSGSTLDTLEYQGFPEHDEVLHDSFGFSAGLTLEWGGRGPLYFRIDLFYRYLRPVAEFENPIYDPISGVSQPRSARVRMDAAGIGLGVGLRLF
jgi:hypothetical protein